MARLDRQALKQLQEQKKQDPTSLPGINLPNYDPSEIKPSIVHFGPGNFSGAHISVYAHELIQAGHKDCGIIAVSPRLSSEFNDAGENKTISRARVMKSQDNLFSVWVKDGTTDEVQIVGSVTDVLVGPNDVQKVIDTMANEQTKLVTMTITLKGYYYDSEARDLKMNEKDVAHSLENADSPRATVAYLVMALEARMKKGLPSFGVMSLDNFEQNSDSLRLTVLAYAGQKSKELRDWIAQQTPFYSTSVDRIVPEPTPEKVAATSALIGFEDKQALASEPYMHLVIGRSKYGPPEMREPPIPLDKVGATYVDDAEPSVLAKLRILNGAHMALGVVGRLAGYTHADEALKNPEIREFIDQYIREASGTLSQKLGHIDYDTYRLKTIERMENEFMHDELVRLARDGTKKIETRFISPLHEAYSRDLPRDHIVTALAAWVKYVASAKPDQSKGDTDEGLFISDAKAYDDGIVEVAKSLNGDISPILAIKEVFGGLEKNKLFVQELSAAYKKLSGYGQQQDFGVKSSPFTPPTNG